MSSSAGCLHPLAGACLLRVQGTDYLCNCSLCRRHTLSGRLSKVAQVCADTRAWPIKACLHCRRCRPCSQCRCILLSKTTRGELMAIICVSGAELLRPTKLRPFQAASITLCLKAVMGQLTLAASSCPVKHIHEKLVALCTSCATTCFSKVRCCGFLGQRFPAVRLSEAPCPLATVVMLLCHVHYTTASWLAGVRVLSTASVQQQHISRSRTRPDTEVEQERCHVGLDRSCAGSPPVPAVLACFCSTTFHNSSTIRGC